MGWKNWPYWVRGGVIADIITVVTAPLILVLMFLAAFSDFPISNNITIIWFIMFGIGQLITKFFYGIFGWATGFSILIGSIVVSLFINFLIGALIGLIVRKMKKKKQNEVIANS